MKGDIHDIGKNICVLMLRNFGYEVIDLGRNVEAELILKTAIEKKRAGGGPFGAHDYDHDADESGRRRCSRSKVDL